MFDLCRMITRWHWSASDSEGNRNLLILERVMLVFTPELVQAIDELSNDFRGWLKQNKEYLDKLTYGASPAVASPRRSVAFAGFPQSPQVGSSSGSQAAYVHIMHAQHKNLFPDPRVNDFKADMGVTDFTKFSGNVSC